VKFYQVFCLAPYAIEAVIEPRVGAGLDVGVAAKGDSGCCPMLSDASGQPAEMTSALNPAWRLAGTQDYGDRARTFSVIDGDRQETRSS